MSYIVLLYSNKCLPCHFQVGGRAHCTGQAPIRRNQNLLVGQAGQMQYTQRRLAFGPGNVRDRGCVRRNAGRHQQNTNQTSKVSGRHEPDLREWDSLHRFRVFLFYFLPQRLIETIHIVRIGETTARANLAMSNDRAEIYTQQSLYIMQKSYFHLKSTNY